nr:hypothetical protein [Candidatus Sigynarchaeota archaeon]
MLFVSEKQKTKKAFTIFGLIAAGLQFTTPFTISDAVAYVADPILTVLPFIVYLYVAIKSTGSLRKQAEVVIIGMIFLLLGYFIFGLLNTLGFVDKLVTSMISPFFAIIGIFVLGHGLTLSISKEPA